MIRELANELLRCGPSAPEQAAVTGDDADDGTSSGGNAPGLSDGTGSLSGTEPHEGRKGRWSARDHEARASVRDHEVRASIEDGEMALSGSAIIYSAPYTVYDQPGAFTEIMARGAAAGCVRQPVTFLYNHRGMVLARVPGTLTLVDTPRALTCRATLDPGNSDAINLYRAVERGDVTTMSIGFICGDDEWNSTYTTRLVKRIASLIDVSAVMTAASPTTSVQVARSADELAYARRRRAEARRELRRIKERRAA